MHAGVAVLTAAELAGKGAAVVAAMEAVVVAGRRGKVALSAALLGTAKP